MNIRPHPRCRARRLALLAGFAVLLAEGSAAARDYIHIPLPPPPREVFQDIKNFFQRLGSRIRGVVDGPDDHRRKSAPPKRSSKTAPPQKSGWDGAKKSVPYRYDDFEAETPPAKRDEAASRPPVTIKNKPAPDEAFQATSPAEPTGTAASTPPGPAPSPPPPPTPPAQKAAEPSNLPYGTPVAGKRGLVYPPGAKQTPESMVDVSDFKPGQIVRDPRTGELFRVP